MDHVYQFTVSGCNLWVRLIECIAAPGFWRVDVLVPEADFAAYTFAPETWQDEVDPAHVPPGQYRSSGPFTGFKKADCDSSWEVEKAMWRVAELFAHHYRGAFGESYGIKIENKHSYDSVPPDPYKQASREADALMEMDRLGLEIATLSGQEAALALQRHELERQWNGLNDKCGPRRRAYRRKA